jgi:hypothetical protein
LLKKKAVDFVLLPLFGLVKPKLPLFQARGGGSCAPMPPFQLLIVVPCHIIVRRQDCCAPMVTSFGIATGIAVMLLSFGPSALLLYKKRLEEYRKTGPVAG